MKPLSLTVILISIAGLSLWTPSNKVIQTQNDPASFLDLFETISSDPLIINSIGTLTSTTDYRFRGKKIDTSYYKYIKNKFSNSSIPLTSDDHFACYKRKLSDSTYLLIMRTPSEYWSSSIKLYIFDLNLPFTPDVLEVAELWGDAGDAIEKHAILYNSSITLFSTVCSLANEETMESKCEDSKYHYKIKGHNFELISKEVIKNYILK